MFAKSEKQIKKQNVVFLGVFRSDKFSWQKKPASYQEIVFASILNEVKKFNFWIL